jgi:CheY-like chemotaxis protein
MAKKVLVVDDEPDVVTYLSTILRDNGYETVEAANGEEALKQVEAAHPDLITLDIAMPEVAGIKAYRSLKDDERTKAIPVVIVTGVAPQFKEYISTRKQVPPPDGYLEKPIVPEQLLTEVRRLIG